MRQQLVKMGILNGMDFNKVYIKSVMVSNGQIIFDATQRTDLMRVKLMEKSRKQRTENVEWAVVFLQRIDTKTNFIID